MSPLKSDLLHPGDVKYLKEIFTKTFPDAVEEIAKGDPDNTAACLWLGFKEGYAIAVKGYP